MSNQLPIVFWVMAGLMIGGMVFAVASVPPTCQLLKMIRKVNPEIYETIRPKAISLAGYRFGRFMDEKRFLGMSDEISETGRKVLLYRRLAFLLPIFSLLVGLINSTIKAFL